ncbi:hypothetical protein NU688_18795 [Variovorax sp. ZS18.2.2]|uniref:hypothetical protein n=1 Tax=Variovorax sp. ZS18.2.2 TaxID=2971255 RepID=UPI0021511C7B|nr:hypothetical protein [Variovorax sp. ZS18.2.2]MCR6478217.1 hypothetical protein [Variovorax sp. ZS18.2.2]
MTYSTGHVVGVVVFGSTILIGLAMLAASFWVPSTDAAMYRTEERVVHAVQTYWDAPRSERPSREALHPRHDAPVVKFAN